MKYASLKIATMSKLLNQQSGVLYVVVICMFWKMVWRGGAVFGQMTKKSYIRFSTWDLLCPYIILFSYRLTCLIYNKKYTILCNRKNCNIFNLGKKGPSFV